MSVSGMSSGEFRSEEANLNPKGLSESLTLNDLPNEVLMNIFFHLGINDWLTTRLVSRTFREIADIPEVLFFMICKQWGLGEGFLYSVRNNNAELVFRFLENHWEKLRKMDYLDQALRLAAGQGHDKIVDLMLRNPDLDENETDSWGRSALDLAVAGNHFATVKVLMDRRGGHLTKRIIKHVKVWKRGLKPTIQKHMLRNA